MHSKFVRHFTDSAGALLLGLAAAMFLANWDSAGLTQPHDPVLGVSMRTLFWVAGLIELVVGLLCLRDPRVWLKLGLVFWLALDVSIYGIGLRWSGPIHDFSLYLDSLAAAFAMTPRLTCWILSLVFLYLLIGSSTALLWLWARSRHYVKMACGRCGGHIEFHVRGIGQRTTCPHCAAEVTLQPPADRTPHGTKTALPFAGKPPARPAPNSFTLVEMLVVIAILGILAAMLLPALAGSKEQAKTAQCQSNEHQISLGMKMYADDSRGFYPESGGELPWDLIDNTTHHTAWMEQIIPYTKNVSVYHCPNDLQSQFSYFNGGRAAYIAAGSNYAAVDTKRILLPAAYVLCGDISGTNYFQANDADKDDYTQNCVGGSNNGIPAVNWQIHNKGQNVLFDDGHAKWYGEYRTNEMTFRYDIMHGWQ
jgi:prepilin-type N-terminal cleavage/methylation domain-containing protein